MAANAHSEMRPGRDLPVLQGRCASNRFLARLAILGLVPMLLLQGCRSTGGGTFPTPPPVPAPSRDPQESSSDFVEPLELTDPRLTLSPAGPLIGRLYPRGERVVLDGQIVREPVAVRNGANLQTFARSSARVNFYVPADRACKVGITDFHQGSILANAGRCRQRMETADAEIVALEGNTAYRVTIENNQTRITISRGELEVLPRAGVTREPLRYGANSSIVLKEGRIVEPKAAPAPTDKAALCREYMAAAERQIRASQAKRCELSGPEWTSGEAIFKRCMSEPDPQRSMPSFIELRNKSIATCKVAPVIG